MENIALLPTAQELLAPWTIRQETPGQDRLDVYLAPINIIDAVKALIMAGGWYLSAITGLDIPQSETSEGEIEILYHFCQRSVIVTLRIRVSYGEPEVPTICGVIPSANLYEREVVELFGVIIEDTPIRTNILLPDDWPDWVYPLRKSFTGLEQA